MTAINPTDARWEDNINSEDIAHSDLLAEFFNLWGLKADERMGRLTAHNDLKSIKAGDKTYDLSVVDDYKAFLADIADGCLDGKASGTDGHVTVVDGHTILGPNGMKYDLLNIDNVSKFKDDAADGKIDGKIANSDASSATNDTTSTSAGGSTGTAAADGTEPTKSDEDIKKEAQIKAMEDKATKLADSLGPEGLMNLIRSGKLPPDIANSPAAMQIINMRISDYQQMVTMMSNMLKLMHELQMAIVNNMR